MNYYEFHIGDYASRTSHLSPIEDIAYRRLLDLYYTREAPLPADVQQIARLIRMRGHEEDIRVVLGEFFESTAEGWGHAKCEEVIQAFREKSGKASKSAKTRWAKEKAQQQAEEVAQRSHCEGNATACQNDANAQESDANALQPQCEGNAPTTHYPLPNTHSSTAKAVGKAPRKKREPSADASPPLTVVDLISEGVKEQHARDWLKVREKHRAPLTPTAWALHKSECLKAGLTPGQGVQVCAAASWRGLDHTWNWRKFLPDFTPSAQPEPVSKFGDCNAVEPA